MLKLVIYGKPLSTNHYLGGTRTGRRYVKPKARAYSEDVKNAFKELSNKKKYVCDIIVSVDYYFGDRRKHDVDNYSKILLDSLNELAYIDDEQIRKLILTKNHDRATPRTEVIIDRWRKTKETIVGK